MNYVQNTLKFGEEKNGSIYSRVSQIIVISDTRSIRTGGKKPCERIAILTLVMKNKDEMSRIK